MLFVVAANAQAQFGKLTKKIPGMGGNSEVDTILSQMDGARVKSAYARITLSLADDIIRRQALRNSTKKSAQGQIEKDQKEIEALDRSIVEKRKLLAELGKQTNGGKYDEKTAQQVDKQTQAEEQQRAEKRAMVDQEIADKEKNEKELSKQDRENYGKLARVLYGAAKQEREALETAKDVKPRAESAAANTRNSPMGLVSTQPKKLNDGMKNLSEILSEGPQHAATLASVANHLAKIGGIDLTDPKFQPKVVTDENEIPTDW
jgi:septal ring factor EnvC (AmiA/AmiB activator)